jgi:DNA repair protein RecO (recombination protein O)
MYERHEAIILHALPYQEYDKILTLFSREGGVIKAIVQRATAKKAIAGATDPLTRVEIMLKPGKNDLFKCGDITVLSQYLKLREQLDRLKAACAIAQIIQQSQMPQKPTPILYSLLASYLEQIPSLKNLTALVDSFYLKLLRHDGSLLIEPHCSTCKAPLTDGFLAKGESLCHNHAPPHAIAMSLMELKTIHDLTHAKTYTEIENLNVSKNLSLKIKELIDDART